MAELDLEDIYVDPNPGDEQKHVKTDQKKQLKKIKEPEVLLSKVDFLLTLYLISQS